MRSHSHLPGGQSEFSPFDFSRDDYKEWFVREFAGIPGDHGDGSEIRNVNSVADLVRYLMRAEVGAVPSAGTGLPQPMQDDGNVPVAENSHPVVMGILALLMTLGAWTLYALFSSEGWTTPRVIGQVAFVVAAIGLFVATASQTLGLRIVAFAIFATYLCVLIAEFVVEARPVAITGGTKSSPLSALVSLAVLWKWLTS